MIACLSYDKSTIYDIIKFNDFRLSISLDHDRSTGTALFLILILT